jgi:phosphonate transport system substrate-binding protein
MLSRRHFLFDVLTLAPSLAIGRNYTRQPLVIGLTPVILDDQLRFLREWQLWLEDQLQASVRFVQRLKYEDISEGVLNEQIDAAWICGFPYIRYRPRMQLLAVPRYKGQLTYHSYIITHRKLGQITRLEQLRDRVFAFSDPDSNSGYLYPTYRFMQQGIAPRQFFRRMFFTWAHRNTIDAVASGLADAGSVDSYVWDEYGRYNPAVAKDIRVIERSPAFGFPPFIVRNTLAAQRVQQLSEILLNMNNHPQGIQLLHQLGLDGFDAGDNALYAGIEEMWQQVSQQQALRSSDDAAVEL